MEVDFLIWVFTALVGMVGKMMVGWDPWKSFGVLSLIVLFAPILQLGLENG